jgi:myb proto-oncogene protein
METATFEELYYSKKQSNHSYTRSKSSWPLLEDETLVQLVTKFSAKKWTKIAAALNNLAHYGERVRTPRQCRERWFNHANPDMNK